MSAAVLVAWLPAALPAFCAANLASVSKPLADPTPVVPLRRGGALVYAGAPKPPNSSAIRSSWFMSGRGLSHAEIGSGEGSTIVPRGCCFCCCCAAACAVGATPPTTPWPWLACWPTICILEGGEICEAWAAACIWIWELCWAPCWLPPLALDTLDVVLFGRDASCACGFAPSGEELWRMALACIICICCRCNSNCCCLCRRRRSCCFCCNVRLLKFTLTEFCMLPCSPCCWAFSLAACDMANGSLPPLIPAVAPEFARLAQGESGSSNRASRST
mmetsp:Transcript_2535/g.5065  ORF Transcript_2535/g.5065 Transcript_2535/m.5065 type:complete len:275 (+) Transcript_2535:2080-2904(+)